MASMAIPAPSAAQPQPREWITPQAQLDRLLKSNAQPIAYPVSQASICPDTYNQGTKLGIANIISQYAVEALSPKLTNWHTALQRMNALPDKVPALPWNMPQILDGKCPIRGDEKKPDGTHYKLSHTHLLYLIPPMSLNELEARVRTYGKQALNNQGKKLYPDQNPLQFRYFWDAARQEHGDIPSNEYQWILISNDVLPESRNRSYQEQAQKVAALSKKAFVNYEVPSLYAAAAACFLHKVATGESLYQAGNEQNGNIHTCTRVKETTQNYRLVIGSPAPSGVSVHCCSYGYDVRENIDVTPLRKF
jgi:hypothetical protein